MNRRGMGATARKAGYAVLAGILATTVPGCRPARAELPFLSDEAETLGKGTSQVELWYLGSTDKKTAGGSVVKTNRNLPGATFGHGVSDSVDLTLGFLRSWGNVAVDGRSASDPGSAVFTLSAKWRFYETATFRIAAKPLVGYSYRLGGTGDDQALSGGGWLLVTGERGKLEVSLNAGFLYTDYRSAAEAQASRSGVWNFSALADYKILDKLKLGLDVGAFTSGDKAASEMPVYALAGTIYSPARNVDLSLGLKFGVTAPDPDFAATAGITVRF